MRKFNVLFLLLSLTVSSFANDGSFYSSGNTLIPLKETTIQMKKEILSLERRGNWMQVDIYFEFFNPGPEKELTVGFVTPPAYGDITEVEETHPQIKDFMVMAGNRILPYKVTKMESSGFKVSDKLANGFDFVYHFTVRFAKGITVIRHSYLYRGGASVEASAEFQYRLTTGTAWAGAAIGDFELNINMGDDSYFAVPDAFTKTPADWTVIGVGRISGKQVFNPYGDEEGGFNLRMAMLRRGKLQLRTRDFKPAKDLSLVVFQLHNEINLWMDPKDKNELSGLHELLWEEQTDSLIHALSDFQLRLYRNLNYARAGYAFKDEALSKAYAKYNWYIPDPAIKSEQAADYYISKEIIQKLVEEEKRRQSSRQSALLR